uniref:Uncharacterized protein n=1 Tax=Rhizophora mucronata TaxID=61149 RepID=A0A2P2NWL3_RHIMU
MQLFCVSVHMFVVAQYNVIRIRKEYQHLCLFFLYCSILNIAF